jgi:hypothetical protein
LTLKLHVLTTSSRRGRKQPEAFFLGTKSPTSGFISWGTADVQANRGSFWSYIETHLQRRKLCTLYNVRPEPTPSKLPGLTLWRRVEAAALMRTASSSSRGELGHSEFTNGKRPGFGWGKVDSHEAGAPALWHRSSIQKGEAGKEARAAPNLSVTTLLHFLPKPLNYKTRPMNPGEKGKVGMTDAPANAKTMTDGAGK